jgi:hypothetical protein
VSPPLYKHVHLLSTSHPPLLPGYLNSSELSQEYNVNFNLSASRAVWGVAAWAGGTPAVDVPCAAANLFQVRGAAYEAFLSVAGQGAAAAPLPFTLLENFKVWYDNGGNETKTLWPFSPQLGTSALYDGLTAFTIGGVAAGVTLASGGRVVASLADSIESLGVPHVPQLVLTPLHIFLNGSGYTLPVQEQEPSQWRSSLHGDSTLMYCATKWSGGWEGAVAATGAELVGSIIATVEASGA